jgi:hypothetical protein
MRAKPILLDPYAKVVMQETCPLHLTLRVLSIPFERKNVETMAEGPTVRHDARVGTQKTRSC